MTTQLMVLAVLALFFGVAWHNQPARKTWIQDEPGTNPNKNSEGDSVRPF